MSTKLCKWVWILKLAMSVKYETVSVVISNLNEMPTPDEVTELVESEDLS